jgi:flagellar motor switch protein FliM
MTVQMVSAVSPRASEPPVGADLEPYDFARPMNLPREQARMLLAALESFARQWNTELATRVRTACAVTVADVTMTTYDDYAASLLTTTAMVLFSIDGMLARGVFQIPLGAALNWTARMLGGAGARDIPERHFSPVEQAIVARTVEDALEILRYSFGADIAQSMRVESIHYVSQTAQAAATNDAMIVATMDVAVDMTSSRVTIALPAAALMERVDGGAASDLSQSPVDLLKAQLESVPVRVALQFQPTDVRPDVVLGLAEGDVIRIAHSKNRPLNFTVEGLVLARAAVGASGSQLACVIVDTQETP